MKEQIGVIKILVPTNELILFHKQRFGGLIQVGWRWLRIFVKAMSMVLNGLWTLFFEDPMSETKHRSYQRIGQFEGLSHSEFAARKRR